MYVCVACFGRLGLIGLALLCVEFQQVLLSRTLFGVQIYTDLLWIKPEYWTNG